MSLRKLFYVVNFGLLGLFIVAVAVDSCREWKGYQKEYYRRAAVDAETRLAAATDEGEKKELAAEAKRWRRRPLEIKQILAKDLGRADRCVTCHVGMDEFTNPTLTNSFKENPFKAHPDISGLIAKHPFQKFACTTCHGGQGLATTVVGAHEGIRTEVGTSHLAEGHMLRGQFIQASCAKCHANFETLPGAEVAALGKKIFDENGCRGCHSVNGSPSGGISVDLGDVADKPAERIAPHDFHLAEMPPQNHDVSVQNWMLAHLSRDPMVFVHNDPEGKYNAEPIAPSGMPPFYEEWKNGAGEGGISPQARALVTYLLSLSHREIPHSYYVYAAAKPEPKFGGPAEHGKFVFKKYGCAGCHGLEAKRGRRNFNAMGPGQDPENKTVDEMAKGRIPTLVETLGTFTADELRKKIQEGVPSARVAKYNDKGPVPPLFMPTWKEKIKGQELDDLVAYLLSIAKKGEEW